MSKPHFFRFSIQLKLCVALVFLSHLALAQPAPSVLGVFAVPTVISIRAGMSGPTTAFITRAAGFTDPVALSLSAEPGWSATFNPNPVTGNTSIVTVTVPPVTAPFLHTLTLAATAGGVTKTGTILVEVDPVFPGFSLFTPDDNQTIERGISIVNTIHILRRNNFTGSVALSVSGLPQGVTANFNPNSTTGTSSELTFTASPNAALGTSAVTITGVGSPDVVTTTVNLTVEDPATTPCGVRTLIALPFAHDGIGEFCFVTAGTITSVNSWNMQLVEINGVPFSNRWSSDLPPRIDGNYHIHYVATSSSAHFEAAGTSGQVNTLVVSPTSRSFGSVPATNTVTVTSNVAWTATSDQPWLMVVPATGVNNGALTLSVTANPGTIPRTGVVTISGGNINQMVGVTQNGTTTTTSCQNPVAATLPLSRDGVGEFCWVTSGNLSFVNSWNAQLVEINGVAFTNHWSDSFPPRINGNYYIHYVANVGWYGHLEVHGSP